MELTAAQIIAAGAGLLSTFTTVVAFLYRQAAKAKDDVIKSKDQSIVAMGKTIDYERAQKQAALERLEAITGEVSSAIREMVSGIDQVGPIVGQDGDLTREHIKQSGRRVITRLGGQLSEDD